MSQDFRNKKKGRAGKTAGGETHSTALNTH